MIPSPQKSPVLAASVGWAGLGLVILYTGLISAADGITKLIASTYTAPQLFAISGFLVAGISAVWAGAGQAGGLTTAAPRAMALRSVLTVLATFGFFMAFRHLPFADVFVFIGIMPVFAGLMSGPMLGERVRPSAWLALIAGSIGVVCLFPAGIGAAGPGHLWALVGALTGTASMLLARLIARSGTSTLAQVFWPNLTLGLVMALGLPFVWQPMTAGDLGLVFVYAGLLFGARFLLVIALRLMAAYVVVPLLNLQFVWMVGIGAVVFGEMPLASTILGAAIVIGSGIYMVADQTLPSRRLTDVTPPPGPPQTDP